MKIKRKVETNHKYKEKLMVAIGEGEGDRKNGEWEVQVSSYGMNKSQG